MFEEKLIKSWINLNKIDKCFVKQKNKYQTDVDEFNFFREVTNLICASNMYFDAHTSR